MRGEKEDKNDTGGRGTQSWEDCVGFSVVDNFMAIYEPFQVYTCALTGSCILAYYRSTVYVIFPLLALFHKSSIMLLQIVLDYIYISDGSLPQTQVANFVTNTWDTFFFRDQLTLRVTDRWCMYLHIWNNAGARTENLPDSHPTTRITARISVDLQVYWAKSFISCLGSE